MALSAQSTHRRTPMAVLLTTVAAVAIAAPVSAGAPSGFLTAKDPMLTPVAPGSSVTPIISVGDTLSSGYRFESIPDGISVQRLSPTRVAVLINHETSTVPFPYSRTVQPPPSPEAYQNDFDNAQVSRLRIRTDELGVLGGKFAIPSSANYQRFCSNYLARRPHGFERPLFFTNEEATDFVSRDGQAWSFSTPQSEPPSEQAGVVVAMDPNTLDYKTIHGMGRLNHENSLALKGFGHPALMTGDDTFSTNPASSQVYIYQALDAEEVWNDEGHLWAFRSDDPAVNDYYDFTPGSGMSVSGEFVRISDAAARGTQAELEAESDAKGVFQFVRIEDMAYDRDDPTIVYMADSGRASTDVSNGFASTNGRIWRMALDPEDPTHVLDLSVLIDGDLSMLKDPAAIHNPDNLETTRTGLLITEDPSSGNQFPQGDPSPAATTARVWRYDIAAGTRSVVARVDQSQDEGPDDVDSAPAGNQGAWESSGIIDVSRWFGPDMFLIDVQAHTLWVEKAAGPDDTGPTPGTPDGQPDYTYKREGGQLLLLHIPGA